MKTIGLEIKDKKPAESKSPKAEDKDKKPAETAQE